ncbi:MAG: hypothetical protein PSW75_07135, partial [bacterium]|nr:hypothetical protein [bacterium]
VPVAVLSVVRGRVLAAEGAAEDEPRPSGNWALQKTSTLPQAIIANWRPFLLCFGLASLTIASGTMNVFYARDLPQSTLYTVFFWANVAPGMLAGAWVVRRWGVGRALALYAGGLLVLSLAAWLSGSARAGLWFALVLPLLNG